MLRSFKKINVLQVTIRMKITAKKSKLERENFIKLKNFQKNTYKKTKTAYIDEVGIKYLISCKIFEFKLKIFKKLARESA